MKLLKVHSVSEVKVSSDSRNYITVQFTQPGEMVEVEGKKVLVESNRNPIGRNLWEQGPEQPDGSFSKGDALYQKVLSKETKFVAGTVETVETEPYQIGDREVTTFSAVVFSNETMSQILKRQGLTRKGEAPVIVEELEQANAAD